MIDKIKLDISSKLNKKVNIKINNIRNKAEILEGVIKELYSRIFVVETIDGIKRSFNYSDILTGNIELDFWQKIINMYNMGRKKGCHRVK